jgi:hypothetical protein
METISNIEVDRMYAYIQKTMPFEKWIPIKTDKAYKVIVQLFREGLIHDSCELNNRETYIKKTDTKNFVNLYDSTNKHRKNKTSR